MPGPASPPPPLPPSRVYDYIVVGSGFGGSVSAMRLAEKGYSVLVLEQGKRFADQDFAQTNWDIRKYLWLPAVRCFGILQMSLFQHVLALHGAGVGGGSLGYANVLMEPNSGVLDAPAWRRLADWKTTLRPHYDTARRMLGVSPNPRLWPADSLLSQVAGALGRADDVQPAQVGVYFGPPGQPSPDPYFDGSGPARQGCQHCGACMLGCRHNAKNTLVKNYLFFAEALGARIQAETEVLDIQPLHDDPHGARYALTCRRSTAWRPNTHRRRLLARSVIVAGGAIGTLRLLLRCRDVTRTLPNLSGKLGRQVGINNESLLGVISRKGDTDFSQGIAITTTFRADDDTTIQPVRYPSGSDLMRLLGWPLISRGSFLARARASLAHAVRRPGDFWATHIFPGWARRTTILLVMQSANTQLKLTLGRRLLTFWRRGLITQVEDGTTPPAPAAIGHDVTRRFAGISGGIASGAVNESLLNVPTTAHLVGGCPMGRDDQEGVVGLDCQAYHYPGLYVIDGSIMPADPGVNPSLTIAALAEYAMSQIPAVNQPARGAAPIASLAIYPQRQN